MKHISKVLKLLVGASMLLYSSVGFTDALPVQGDAAVVAVLTDGEMMGLVGGEGYVEADITTEYNSVGDLAKAFFVNRSTDSCTYVLEVTDINGNVLEVLATGMLLPGEATVAQGTPTTNANVVVARIHSNQYPALQARDISIAN